MEELLKSGCRSLEAKNQDGQTAVHLACQLNEDGILRKLIAARANVNCRDTEGNTPLHVSEPALWITLSMRLRTFLIE